MDPRLPDAWTGWVQDEGLHHVTRPRCQSELTGIIFHVFLQAKAAHLKKRKKKASFTMAKRQKQTKFPPTDGWIIKRGLYTQCTIIQPWKRKDIHHRWAWRPRATWNEPVGESPALWWFPLDEALKSIVKWWWSSTFIRWRRVLEMDGGDGCMTSVNVLNTRGLDTDKQSGW